MRNLFFHASNLLLVLRLERARLHIGSKQPVSGSGSVHSREKYGTTRTDLLRVGNRLSGLLEQQKLLTELCDLARKPLLGHGVLVLFALPLQRAFVVGFALQLLLQLRKLALKLPDCARLVLQLLLDEHSQSGPSGPSVSLSTISSLTHTYAP